MMNIIPFQYMAVTSLLAVHTFHPRPSQEKILHLVDTTKVRGSRSNEKNNF